MTKEESLYQVKLIIDYLTDEEYEKIPKETIAYIEENMQYNENITINPLLPLESQDIDEQTYSFLEKLIPEIEKTPQPVNTNAKEDDLLSNMDINELKKLLNKYKEENSKLPKAKELIENYKKELDAKNLEIEELKKTNQILYDNIQKCPKIFRKILFRDFNNKLIK